MNVRCKSIESILSQFPTAVHPLQACDCDIVCSLLSPHHPITISPRAYLHVVEKSLSYFIHSAFITLSVVTCAAAMLLLNYNYAKANRNTYNPSQKVSLNLFLQPLSPSSHRIRPPSRPATAGTPCCSRTPACRASHSPGCASRTSTGGRTVTWVRLLKHGNILQSVEESYT